MSRWATRVHPVRAGASGPATVGARVALLYLVATGAVQATLLWSGLARPWLVVVGLGATTVAVVLLTSPCCDPLPLGMAIYVAALPATDAACALAQVAPSHPGLVWLLAIGAGIGGLLAAGGRVATASAGAGLAVAVVIAWGLAHRTPPTAPAIALPLIALVAGTLWRRAIDRHAATSRQWRTDEQQAQLAASATRDAARSAQAELLAIGREAGPVLRKIAGGGSLTPTERAEIRLLEARLRDRIRATSLAREPVAEACDRARRNGADVLLLDDGGGAVELPPQLLDRVAEIVRRVAGGRVIVRVLPPGRDTLVTVLVDHGGRVRAEALGATGTIVRSTSRA